MSIGQKGNRQNQQDPDYWGDWMRHHYETNLKPRFANQSWTWDKFTKLSRDDKDDFEFWLDLRRLFEPPVAKTKNSRPKGTWELTLTYSRSGSKMTPRHKRHLRRQNVVS